MKDYLVKRFKEGFSLSPDLFLRCGGRFEVLGNHTDHNHGLCLAATCNLLIYAAIKKRDDLSVNAISEGYDKFTLDLSSLDSLEEEKNKPASLIRGIASYLKKNYKIGGFDIYIKSNVPSGAGVSSSAAFELLLAQTFNYLFNEKQIPLMTLCKASQYAERYYYGKMCGLLDQIGVAYGGLVNIDFKDIDNPVVEQIKMDFKDYQFVIINSGGSHAGLSHLYDSIPNDMNKVAKYFNKQYLRDIDYSHLEEKSDDVIAKCGLIAYYRAVHFFEENIRVKAACETIKKNDVQTLLYLMNESRVSSTKLLKNMYVDKIEGSPLEACDLVLKASDNQAGVKINGGGFAGSVIALIPNDKLDNVLKSAKERYGESNIHLVDVFNNSPSDF